MLLGLSVAAAARPRAAAAIEPLDRRVDELERLVEGLLFPSEADAPLAVVRWPRPAAPPSAAHLAALVGEPHPAIVEELAARDWLRSPATPRPWHDAEERLVATRFTALAAFFDRHLPTARAFRFGRVTLRTYAVGVTTAGDWLGLTATEVET
ncbi:MAG TPA: nuclease A inhibitor family protein [Polyangia bacterium]|nr:nuclease A inhibitor family protein [Polyangia bacterium]